jgi:hypothetical protein
VRRYLLILCISASLVAVGWRASPHQPPAQWVRVVRDANYDVAIDTTRVRRDIEAWRNGRYLTSDVWYRTDHRVPRLHNEKPFTREVVHSIVRCDSLWFRVISVDMSMGDSRPISQQRMTPEEVAHQLWRRVAPGTSEEMAAQAACHFAAKRRR